MISFSDGDSKDLFDTLPFVLPCKFCRSSLSEYMEEDPIDDNLTNLEKWLYRIHNKVNEKLRGQGLLKESNPPFNIVSKIYEERLAQGCSKTDFEGWDFLFSIAENHPYSVKKSLPIVNESITGSNAITRNRLNTMEPNERYIYYSKFWKSLGAALPFKEWRDAWKNCNPDYSLMRKRYTWIKELWRIRCCLENKLDLVNRENFGHLCKRLRTHKSGCATRKKAKTCRKTRHK